MNIDRNAYDMSKKAGVPVTGTVDPRDSATKVEERYEIAAFNEEKCHDEEK